MAAQFGDLSFDEGNIDKTNTEEELGAGDDPKLKAEASASDKLKPEATESTGGKSKIKAKASAGNKPKPEATASAGDKSKLKAKASAGNRPKPKAMTSAGDKSKPKAEASAGNKSKLKAKASAGDKPKPKAMTSAGDKSKLKAKASARDQPKLKAKASAGDKPKPEATASAGDKPKPKATAYPGDKPKPKAMASAGDQCKLKATASAGDKPKPKAMATAGDKSKPKAKVCAGDKSKLKAMTSAGDKPKPKPKVTASAGDQPRPEATASAGDQPKPEATASAGDKPKPKVMASAGEQPRPEATASAGDQPRPEATASAGDQPKPEAMASAGDRPKPGAMASAGEQPRPKATASAGHQPKPETTASAGDNPKPEAMASAGEQPRPEATASAGDQPKPEVMASAGDKPKPEGMESAGDQPRPEATASTGDKPKPEATASAGVTAGEVPNAGEDKEISIVLAGKSGAGKSTLIGKLLGQEKQLAISPDHDTDKIERLKTTKHGVTINMIDTPGLETSSKKQLQKLAGQTDGKVNFLIYCVPVNPANKFDDSNPKIMKSLYKAYGKEIWQKCVLVFTFSNDAKRTTDRMKGNPEENYKNYIRKYTAKFQDELRNELKVKNISVESILDIEYDTRDLSEVIIAVPAGYEDTDKVIPNREENWIHVLFAVMLKKSDHSTQPLLLKYKFGPEAVKKGLIGAASGAAAGALTGAGAGAGLLDGKNSVTNTMSKDEEAKVKEFIRGIEAAAKMSGGKINRKLAHVMFVGPPGSGKSSLMNNLLGRLRKKFSSTGVCDSIVIVDVTPSSLHAATIIDCDTWEETECDLSFVRQMGGENVSLSSTSTSTSQLHSHQKEDAQPSQLKITNSSKKVIAAEKQASQNRSQPQQLEVKEVPAVSLEPTKKLTNQSFKQSISSVIKEYGIEEVTKYLKKTSSLYLRDTGGQVEFQEMLAVLISGPSIIIFVFRTDLDIKSNFEVQYRKSDSEILNAYTSSITTEEALLQCLASVYAIDTSGEDTVKMHQPLVFIVGTHIDKLGSEREAKISGLNQHLDSIIMSNGFGHLVQYADKRKGHVMFTADNTSQNEESFQLIRSGVNTLISRSEFNIEYPISYLLFCLDLQNVKKSVLALEECHVLAANHGIMGDQVIHLLHFLHLRIGLIRYYDVEGLRHLIIREPQVLFNKTTDLIALTFSNRSLFPGEATDLEKKGIVTARAFASLKSVSDQIRPEDYLKVLVHLRITAPLHMAGDQEERYFLPCVLNHVPESTKEDLETDIAPICVKFKCNHCPKGIYGVLVTHLMRPEGDNCNTTFTLLEGKIFKDQVSFEVQSVGVRDKVTLKLFTSHLEISLLPDLCDNRDTSVKEVCSNIREIINNSIVQSLKDLHYDKEKVEPVMCFKCDHCGKLHQVTKGKEHHKIYCEMSHKTIRIPPHGRCWYNEDCDQPSRWELLPEGKCITDKSELLRKHRISLEKVVTQNMTWLAHKMNSSGLLPDETHSDVINPRSMLTEAQKATNIVQSLKKKVDIDRSNWDKFVEILKQEPLYSDILTLFSHEPPHHLP